MTGQIARLPTMRDGSDHDAGDEASRDLKSVRVFVSHKHEDRHIANKLKRCLERYVPNRLELFVSGENIIAGDDYQDRIRDELRICDLLLLIFTAPTKNWDWCLFEAGLFTPLLSDDERRRIISIYPPDSDGPRPLKKFQGVKAVPDDLFRFFDGLLRTTDILNVDPVLNSKLSDSDITEIAQEFSELFQDNDIEPYYPGNRIIVHLPAGFELNLEGGIKGIPNDAIVEGSDKSLALFGLGGGKCRWSELTANVTKHGLNYWAEELAEAFESAAQRRLMKPVTAVLRTSEDGRLVRPFIYKLDFKNKRPSALHIAFCEEAAAPDVGGPMFRLLKMATQFREEVIDTYYGKLDRRATDSGAEAVLNELMTTIEAIEYEAARAKLDDRKDVMSKFSDSGEDRKIISGIFDEWEQIRADIVAAREGADIEKAEACLKDMLNLNGRFLSLASKRYRELVQNDVNPH